MKPQRIIEGYYSEETTTEYLIAALMTAGGDWTVAVLADDGTKVMYSTQMKSSEMALKNARAWIKDREAGKPVRDIPVHR